jgi:hypothetical protein
MSEPTGGRGLCDGGGGRSMPPFTLPVVCSSVAETKEKTIVWRCVSWASSLFFSTIRERHASS